MSGPDAPRTTRFPGGTGSVLRLGISACLLGECVRYNGESKTDNDILALFGDRVSWVPVCPEVGAGLGVPREPMRLEGDVASPRLITIDSRVDRTRSLITWSERFVRDLLRTGVDGFVLKARSPSCGPRVDVFDGERAMGLAAGVFASYITRAMPLLPVTDEEELKHPARLGDFVRRAQAFRQSRRAGQKSDA